MAVTLLKDAVFFQFLAWEWLHKAILVLFVKYQELVGLDQCDVLKDTYQKEEKRQER